MLSWKLSGGASNQARQSTVDFFSLFRPDGESSHQYSEKQAKLTSAAVPELKHEAQ